MPDIETPEPLPTPSYGGVGGPRIVQPLTLDHPHCMVATRAFTAGFIALLDGTISPGVTFIREGQLADDRGALVFRFPDNWRRPTEADRQST
jgi:hypothetical protein